MMRLVSPTVHPIRYAPPVREVQIAPILCVAGLTMLGIGLFMGLAPQPPRVTGTVLRVGAKLVEDHCACLI